jgi:hypothetical protein
VDEERRQWLARVVVATNEAIERLEHDDNVHRHRELIRDLWTFRHRLIGELQASPNGHKN